jgi:hypothetical protein
MSPVEQPVAEDSSAGRAIVSHSHPSKERTSFLEAGRWAIRDSQRKRRTRCLEGERGEAEKALAQYLAEKQTPNFRDGDPDHVSITGVLILYSNEHALTTARPEMVASAIESLGAVWKGKTVGKLSPSTCGAYAKWRTKQPQARYKDPGKAPKVGRQTARRDLETLSAAIGYAHTERKLRYAGRAAAKVRAA